MRVLSADWVVPVEGPPIRDGAVAIEDGLIVAVGTVAELGGGERYRDAVILPGFVNAHSHLEYAVYGGFGDGLDFPAWMEVTLGYLPGNQTLPERQTEAIPHCLET